MSSAITIDFGDTLLTSQTLATMPTLPATVSGTSTGDIDVSFNWSDSAGNGKWSELFTFKTDSSDLADFASGITTDVEMDACSNKFYTANFLDDDALYLADGTGSLVDTTAGTGNTIAEEYVRYLASEIFGANGRADLFHNEAALVSDITGSHSGASGVLANIKAKLDNASATDQASTNPLWIVMSNLLNDASGIRFDVGAPNASTLVSAGSAGHYMPLKAGDKLVFSLNFNAVTASTHKIGDNDVGARKYKITMTLAA